MAAVKNPERYHIIAFSANFALSGGVVFAKDSENNYFVVSEFARSEINSRRYPYQGIIEDNSYLFTETGQTATGLYTLYCVDGIIDSSGGGGSSEGSSSPDEGSGVPAAANYRESAALQALNAMIQMVPNPTAYKESTVRLLTQKAFEFSNEFLKQASLVREETGEGDGPAGGGGGATPISSQSLNGLPAITKVVFCTSYPANGEQRTLYVKLKKREQGEGA